MSNSLTDTIDEAIRQVTICNACRYCEGYCAVFPAIQRNRQFTVQNINHLSNLCHNCRACYYACQYTEPHEFRINIPQALANARVESWQQFVKPTLFAKTFQRHGVMIAFLLLISFSIFIAIVRGESISDADSFYDYMNHNLMVLIFLPAFLLPLLAVSLAVRNYWKHTGGETIKWRHVSAAVGDISKLKNLSGGQGQGCNFEKEDQFTNARRHYHQATLFGFLLCFASTSSGTILHYVFSMPAPYAWYALPKLLGVPGGILLCIGCTGLAYLKTKADQHLGATHIWGAEMAFVVILGLTGFTGLLLYAATGSTWVPTLLAIHLANVLTLFLLLPYSKMVHGFFRTAALIREQQLKS